MDPTEPYTLESWWPLRRRFLEIWPGVGSERVYMVLRQASEQGTPGIQALLEEALRRGGPEAADLLMAPVAATFPFPDHRDRPDTVTAIDALIRAGGDPTPALPALARALEDRHVRAGALSALRRATLAGHSLESIRGPLEAAEDPRGEVAKLRGLAFFQHPSREATIASIRRVHDNQPFGNLRGGIGIVEQLITSEGPEARRLGDAALVELLAAGEDAYRTWLALLPALRWVLRRGAVGQGREALHALQQLRYTLKHASALGEDEALGRALPTLEAVLLEVAPLLEGELAAPAAQLVHAWAELGVSLEGARGRIEAALKHPDAVVRSECSQGLTLHLRRTDEEPRLPRGVSRRRVYAADDTPLRPGAAPGICVQCGATAVHVIYEENDGMQFYSTTTVESRCGACGLYFVAYYGG
ncbi:MAG: hypothetical protein H6741_19405 [Alphaproteobacteria bacterium]|nr:hypothetical protein [Alphaproteobacteria bacterium]